MKTTFEDFSDIYDMIETGSIVKNGCWYSVEISDCLTWVILTDRHGIENRFYNDDEDLKYLKEWLSLPA